MMHSSSAILIGSKAENAPSLSEQEEPVATAQLEISPGEEVEINETSSDGVAAVDYDSGANAKEQGTTPIPLTTPIIAAKSEPFSCYHCNNCLTKASMAVQPCDAGVISCYVSAFLLLAIEENTDGYKLLHLDILRKEWK